MASKLLICISANRTTVARWRGGRLSDCAVFSPDDTGVAEFRDYVARELDPARDRKVAMFCTGGIRCEKASAYLLDQGFAEVYHLKGGILNYLEKVPEADSRWTGGCFVFDERVALGHGLTEVPETAKGVRF